MSELRRDVVAFVIGVTVAKAYYDLLQFLYYRERVCACKQLVSEGMRLVERAMEPKEVQVS